jgi:hypothetical protein
MQAVRLARASAFALIAGLTISAATWRGQAQTQAPAHAPEDHGMSASGPPAPLTPQQNDLVQAVKIATGKFKNVTDIAGPGSDYALTFGCVSGGDFGAMGLHYLKGSILHDGMINIDDPEIILFEPTRNGGIQITGADYLVFASEFEAKNGKGVVPSLKGQLFHFFDSPNRFGLDPFYTLHVWAWKDNPNGTFTNWNPNVSCDAFNPRLLTPPGR